MVFLLILRMFQCNSLQPLPLWRRLTSCSPESGTDWKCAEVLAQVDLSEDVGISGNVVVCQFADQCPEWLLRTRMMLARVIVCSSVGIRLQSFVHLRCSTWVVQYSMQIVLQGPIAKPSEVPEAESRVSCCRIHLFAWLGRPDRSWIQAVVLSRLQQICDSTHSFPGKSGQEISSAESQEQLLCLWSV